MKICFVADGRSSIARGWIVPLIESGEEVHLISSYPYTSKDDGLTSTIVVPLMFASLAEARKKVRSWRSGLTAYPRASHKAVIAPFRPRPYYEEVADWLRHYLGVLTLGPSIQRLRAIVRSLEPDVVHALRVPFEGIVSALAVRDRPVVVSTWGNDLTLWARRYKTTGWLTRLAIQRASAIMSDCYRDVDLAMKWGFGEGKPWVVLPGAGGVDSDIFQPRNAGPGVAHRDALVAQELNLDTRRPIVVNPRGIRAYTRTETFFLAIPRVLQRYRDVQFVAVDVQGEPSVHRWASRLGVGRQVRLLPRVSPEALASLFRLSSITVSPGEHDGTPNSVLEAMACGSFPIAGDIEPLREWIENGVNGSLFHTSNPAMLADAITQALNDDGLRARAAKYNLDLIRSRAYRPRVTMAARTFYREVLAWSQKTG